MHPVLKQLVALQELDNEILGFERRLEDMPSQIETSKLHLDLERKSVESSRQELEGLKKKRQQFEREAATETDQLSKTKVKQASVKTNEEFTALKAEIEFIKEKISAIEDEELAAMETLEGKEKILPQLEFKYKEEEKKFQEFKKQKEAAIETVKKDLAGLRKKRLELSKAIEPTWVNHYQKVGKMRGSKIVVAIIGDQCQGCHQQLKPQLVIDVKVGKKVFECDRCNRIVYWQSEEEAEVVAPE